jgi:ketosteroid isomerase-like protein
MCRLRTTVSAASTPTGSPGRRSSSGSARCRFKIVELDVTVGADVASAYALVRCGTPEDFAANPDNRLRMTIGLRKRDGHWVVTHEHHSFPMVD